LTATEDPFTRTAGSVLQAGYCRWRLTGLVQFNQRQDNLSESTKMSAETKASIPTADYANQEEWREVMAQEYWARSIFGTDMELECYGEKTGWYFGPYGWFDTAQDAREYRLIQMEYEWQDGKEENRFPGWQLRYGRVDYEDDRYYDYGCYDSDSDSDDGRYYGYGFR